jgi:hypothetical protein
VNSVVRPETTYRFDAPEGWDQDRVTCTALAVERTEMAGLPVLRSYWRPTAKELLLLNQGGHVRLDIVEAPGPAA